MSESILITGGAGFIGSHLADRLLAAGHRVRGFDNLTEQVHGGDGRPDYLDEEVELVVGDMRDPEAVRAALDGVDAVVHLAARVGVGQSMCEIANYTAENSAGTAIATDGSAPYTATWDTTSLASGGYEVRAVATDGAGNAANGHAVTVTVDSSAPTVTLADPGSPLHGAVTLTAIAGASARSVAFEVSRAGAASWRTIGTDTSTPWSTSFDTRTVRDGVYDLRAVASDAFGNTRASVRAGIRIDNTAPSLASSTPSEGATVASASSIELVASEALASVTGVTLNGAQLMPRKPGPSLGPPTVTNGGISRSWRCSIVSCAITAP